MWQLLIPLMVNLKDCFEAQQRSDFPQNTTGVVSLIKKNVLKAKTGRLYGKLEKSSYTQWSAHSPFPYCPLWREKACSCRGTSLIWSTDDIRNREVDLHMKLSPLAVLNSLLLDIKPAYVLSGKKRLIFNVKCFKYQRVYLSPLSSPCVLTGTSFAHRQRRHMTLHLDDIQKVLLLRTKHKSFEMDS